MSGWILLSAAAASAMSAPVAPPADQSQQIVVEGQRSRARAIHDFVTAVTPSHIGGQLVRYESAVCPAAAGLSSFENQRVAARLRQVAATVGVPLAPEGCAPNTLAIVVDGKNAFIAALRKKYPVYFSRPPDGYIEVPHEPGPATAWHINGLLTANHTPAAVDPIYHHYLTSSMDSSRLVPSTIPHFLAGVVVIERRAVAGLTTTQVADYAALRLYATTKPQELKRSASSILGVLDAPMGSAVPLTLTNWDLSFLKGLYHTQDRQYANRQRNQIEGLVRRGTAPDTND